MTKPAPFRPAIFALTFFALACAAEVAYRRPVVRYETPPPLVEVEPGVQVVPDQEEEVFYTGGAYWARRDDRWWRSPDHRGSWEVVERGNEPARLRAYPVGQYRRYRSEVHPVVPVR